MIYVYICFGNTYNVIDLNNVCNDINGNIINLNEVCKDLLNRIYIYKRKY